MIPYSTQTIDDDDIKAVVDTLRSPYLTCGPAISTFEENVCSYVNCNYAVAVNSCTSALHLAMLACNITSKDRVFVSAISFVASSNCARFLGADIDFVDVNPNTGNMNVDCLEQMLIDAKKENRLPKAVVAVHMSGRSCDVERIYKLKQEYDFYLIEDAAHAIGGSYNGFKIGSCQFSDITVFSFHPVKIITTAEGGMCLTNDDKLFHKMKQLSSHGIERDKEILKNPNMPAFYYEMQDLGFNYRMTDIQAALGTSQLKKIDEFVSKRAYLATVYDELLRDEKELIRPILDTNDNKSAWHLYQVGIPFNLRDKIYESLHKKGIGVQVHYLPIYRHPYYQNLKDYPLLKGAEEFFNKTLSLPLYPKLKQLDLQMTVATLLHLIDKEKQS